MASGSSLAYPENSGLKYDQIKYGTSCGVSRVLEELLVIMGELAIVDVLGVVVVVVDLAVCPDQGAMVVCNPSTSCPVKCTPLLPTNST